MRLMLVCIMAAKLPTTKDATAKMVSMADQSAKLTPMPAIKMRNANTVAAILGTDAIKAVTAVGEP